ncbi:uncharacterized protein [Clytia hemisphaerica]|uniref:uncharacterized protein n=1 Tax=Clytia hemisphaerica TaxID=252671 RepID=UPI0034D4280C
MINLKHAAPFLFMISFACYYLQVQGSHQHICTNPQRHTREYGSSDFSGYNGLTYMACSQQCQATGRNHMQWWYDEEPTAIAGGTGNCVCLGNIAGTTFASRGIYCQMSSYGTGAVNGQWSPWTTWTGKCALKSTSTNPQMKRTRLCNKFPPSYNSGRSSCGGSSVDNVRGGACLESKMDYYVTKNQGINVPAGTTITASFAFEYKLIEENNDQEFSLYVSAKKMNANQTAAELGLVLGNFGCVKSASESLDLPNEDFCLSSVEKDSNDQVYRRITKKDTFKSTTMVETDHKLTWDYNYKMTAATERQERYITTIFHMKDQTSKMERIFVKQFAHKLDISSPVQQIYSFRAKFMRHNNHFAPGFLFWMRFEYHRQGNAGTTRVWNIVSKVYSPQILLDKTSLVVPAGEIGESQHFHNPRGPMTYMYKYMDPTFTSSRFLDFQFDYPLNEMTLFVGKSHTMRNFMDYTYCVHGDDICSDVYKFHFETKSEESEPEVIYGGQEFFMDLNQSKATYTCFSNEKLNIRT